MKLIASHLNYHHGHVAANSIVHAPGIGWVTLSVFSLSFDTMLCLRVWFGDNDFRRLTL